MSEFSAFITRVLDASEQIISVLNNDDERTFKELKTRHSIGAGGDVSIGADLLFERIFTTHLLEIADLDSEESGVIKRESFQNLDSENLQFHTLDSQNPRDIVILDPLDGSDNFLSNIPYFGASLALADGKSGEIKEAIILNFCNKTALAKSNSKIFKINLLTRQIIKTCALDFENLKCGVFEKAYSNPNIAKSLQQQNIKFRSLGASALSIALALECKFFLFIGEIRRFDCAAGLFIIQNAANLHIRHTRDFLLISADEKVFKQILKILQ